MGYRGSSKSMDIKMKNKKGQIFTILAITLIVLMFLSIQVYSHYRDKEAIKDRVKSMDSFLHSLENNLERQGYISGFRIIFLANSEKILNDGYLTSVQDFFEEAFFNGTVDGTYKEVMLGATLDDIVASVNDKARKINVNISMKNTNISVSQEDPWNVKFVITSNFVMEDLQGLAKWEKTQNITAYIPVTGFEDPVYLRNSGKLSKKINQTIFEGYYNVSGDLMNLSEHIQKGYFANNTDAPSFLKRLVGDLTPDPNGIESFVDTNNLSNSGVDITQFDPTGTKTTIDYLYFNKSITIAGSTIPGVPSIFRIDDGHKARYQLI